MTEEETNKPKAKVVREQLRKPEMRKALRSHHKAVAHDEQFDKLLERLEQSEKMGDKEEPERNNQLSPSRICSPQYHSNP
jgi:hypothetical protein